MQALLAARQEREIQLKMLLTRGEAVQRNTSAEGVPVIRKQIQDLKDSWDSLLSSCIRCKRWSSSSLSFTWWMWQPVICVEGYRENWTECIYLINAVLRHACSPCADIVLSVLQPTGGCVVTMDQLPGGRESVCAMDGSGGGDPELLRQTVLGDEGQDR